MPTKSSDQITEPNALIQLDGRQGIQSIEVGAELLRQLAASAKPLSLKDLSERSAMSATKAHRYLVSFCRIGLTEQNAETGHYDLGPFALVMGLTRLARTDALAMARPVARALRDSLDLTVSVAVWGNRGPTLVYWLDSTHPIAVNLKVGSVLPVARSSNGRCFAAHLPRQAIEALMPESDWPSLTASMVDVKKYGAARAQSDLLPGINSFSAPVLDAWAVPQVVISVIGHADQLDVAWTSPALTQLLAQCVKLSDDLGFKAS